MKENLTAGIDLNEIIVSNPASTYFMRIKGNSLRHRHILEDDMLAVDRSRPPLPGCLTVFCRNGEFLCRELVRNGEGLALKDSSDYIIAVDDSIEIFGVVTGVVRKI